MVPLVSRMAHQGRLKFCAQAGPATTVNAAAQNIDRVSVLRMTISNA